MMHISILIPQGAILASLEGSRQLFAQVNQLIKMNGGEPVFNIQLVGLKHETPVAGGLFTVNANALIGDVTKTDLIVIPAIDGDLKQAMENNKDFLPWLVEQKENGAEHSQPVPRSFPACIYRIAGWQTRCHTLDSR